MENILYTIGDNGVCTCNVYFKNGYYNIAYSDINFRQLLMLSDDEIKKGAFTSLDGNKIFYYFHNKIFYTNLQDI